MDSVAIPPDLQQFAVEAVAAGRYRDVGELVAAGVGLLKQREQDCAALLKSVLGVQQEGGRLS